MSFRANGIIVKFNDKTFDSLIFSDDLDWCNLIQKLQFLNMKKNLM